MSTWADYKRERGIPDIDHDTLDYIVDLEKQLGNAHLSLSLIENALTDDSGRTAEQRVFAAKLWLGPWKHPLTDEQKEKAIEYAERMSEQATP